MDSGTISYDNETLEPASPDHIVADEDEEVLGFSDYGDSLGSSGFTSVASYVLRHTHEDGRRYQSFKPGGYPLPNDDIEQEREEMKHQMMKRLLDGHDFLAPIGDHPQKILDIGTGSGLWAIDVADKYPSAQVIGVDITPIQTISIPHNLTWRIDDIQNTTWYPPYSNADFIHLRSVAPVLEDPLQVISSAFQNLKPGGWIEFQESATDIGCDDDTLPDTYPLLRFMQLFDTKFSEAHRWDTSLPYQLPQILTQTGYINVHSRRHKIPIGAWAKDRKWRELGLFMSKHVLWQLICAVLVKWAEFGLESKEEADTMKLDIRKAMDDPEIHAYLPWISVWAQKPPV